VASNLQQSIESVKLVNQVMELYLQSSINLHSEVLGNESKAEESIDCDCSLKIIIHNTSQFPISGFNSHLRLISVPKKNEISFILTSFQLDSGVTKSEDKNAFQFDLAPYSKKTLLLNIKLPTFAQYNATIFVGFPSPGTGSLIQKSASFGIYLIDQCLKQKISKENETEKNLEKQKQKQIEAEVEVSVEAFRKLFMFKPADGLSINSSFLLKIPKGEAIEVRVLCIHEDGKSAVISLSVVNQNDLLSKIKDEFRNLA